MSAPTAQIASHYDKITLHKGEYKAWSGKDNGGGGRDSVQNTSCAAKSYLLERIQRECSIYDAIDFCHGRGGDNRRIRDAFRHLETFVGVDLAQKSLQESMRRWLENASVAALSKTRFVLFEGNAFDRKRVAEAIEEHKLPVTYDLATCFFAMHYGAHSRDHLATMLQDIAARLVANGKSRFVATLVDSDALRMALREEGVVSAAAASTAVKGAEAATEWVEWKCAMAKVRIERKHLASPDAWKTGTPYNMTLGEHVDGLQEHVVESVDLIECIHASGMEVAWASNMAQWLRGQHKAGQMRHLRPSDDEWRVIELYMMLDCRQRSDKPAAP